MTQTYIEMNNRNGMCMNATNNYSTLKSDDLINAFIIFNQSSHYNCHSNTFFSQL